MDDFTVTATTQALLDEFANVLTTAYTIKRLGEPHALLGWTVQRTANGALHISQPTATACILRKAEMHVANGKPTPYQDGVRLHGPTDQDEPLSNHSQLKEYQQILGDLRYIADSTPPDIYFVINRLSVAAKATTTRHWNALKRVLRYFRQNPQHGLLFPAAHLPLHISNDTDKPISNTPWSRHTRTLTTRQMSTTKNPYLVWSVYIMALRTAGDL